MSNLPKNSKHKRVGYGRRRLDNSEMLERIVRDELEAIYKKVRGSKDKPGQPLTVEEAKKIEALSRAQQNLDERRAKLQNAELEAEVDADDLTPEQIREAMNELRKKQQQIQEDPQE